jgi:hypothetical protein
MKIFFFPMQKRFLRSVGERACTGIYSIDFSNFEMQRFLHQPGLKKQGTLHGHKVSSIKQDLAESGPSKGLFKG